MKKNLLFVIDSLHCAGAEKSLTTLLSMLNYSKWSVDLLLFARGGALESLVPKEVNILTLPAYLTFTGLPFREALLHSAKKLRFGMLAARIKYSAGIRVRKCTNAQKARIFWQSVSNVIEDNPKVYDIAISYAQGVPTFYVDEKIKAKRKFAWVNVSYRLNEKEQKFQKKFYDEYNKIIVVSDTAREIFLETFPAYIHKTEVIYDINNPQLISRMAEIGNSYKDDFSGIKLLTIGRLADQKGYDIALEACKKLKEKGLNFRWYALGKGPLQSEIEEYIRKNDLSGHFILLGVHPNPYPFIKNCDIYVQTSRFEGFGIAIAEARMLNIPVVTTRFDAVYSQMVNGKNGLVVDMNADAVCDGILRLINDMALKGSIVKFLQNEKKGNVEEIEKVYQLLAE